MTNNLAECWNSWVKNLKDLPVDTLVDALREKIMNLFHKRNKLAKKLGDDGEALLPSVIHQINARSRGLKDYAVKKSTDGLAQVIELHNKKEVVRHVVNYRNRECTCREWQVTGKPCAHALAFIKTQRNVDLRHFVSSYFNIQSFRDAYKWGIDPMPDRHQWPEVDKGFVLHPPLLKKKAPGREKKNRIPSCLEKGSGKIKRQSKCRTCGETGHRQGSAKCIFTAPKKRYTLEVSNGFSARVLESILN